MKAKLKKTLNLMIVYLFTLSSVIQPEFVFAQADGSHWVNESLGLMQGMSRMYQQGMQRQQAMRMQAAQQQQMQQMMSMMVPKVVPPSNMPLPFQGCVIPQAQDGFPDNACEGDLVPPQDGGRAQMYNQLAKLSMQNIDFYERMADEGKNETSTIAVTGLQCLKDRMKLEEQKFQNLLNALTAKMDQIKKKNEEFKEANKLLKEQMKDVNSILNGGGMGNANRKARRLSDLIPSQECRDILGEDKILQAQIGGKGQGGLIGLRVGLTQSQGDASQFVRNEGRLKKEARDQITRIANDIDKYGIADFMQGAGDSSFNKVLGETTIKSIQSVATPQIQKMDQSVKRIQRELKNLGVNPADLPPMDNNFNIDFNQWRQGFVEDSRKQYIHDCVYQNNNGVGLGDVRTLLGSLKQPGARGRGTLNTYRRELEAVLDNNGNYVEDMMTRVKGIVDKYGESSIVIEYNKRGKRVQENIYTVLTQTIQGCQQLYETDETFSSRSSGAGKLSPKAKIDRAQKYLDEYKSLNDRFKTELLGALENQVMNCSGQQFKAGSCKDSGAFSPTSDSFCFSHARQCAGQINQCFGQLQQQIEVQTQKLNTMADKYNQDSKTLIAAQNELLNALKTDVNAYAQMIGRVVPGSPFTFPSDMFVETPMPSESAEFGVLLVGGGDVTKLFEQLPQKIEKLKGSLREQNGRMMDNLGTYIANQEKNIKQKNIKNWQLLERKCKDKFAKYNSDLNRYNQEGLAAQQKTDQEVGEFCKKFGDLPRDNPMAGCDQADDLYEDSIQIAAHLSSGAEQQIAAYRNLCAAAQNEAEPGTEDNGPTEAGDIFGDCLANADSNSQRIKNDLIDDILDQLPEDFDESAARAYMNGTDNDVYSNLRSENRSLARRMKQIRRVINDRKDAADLESDLNELFAATPTQPQIDAINARVRAMRDACANHSSTNEITGCEAAKRIIDPLTGDQPITESNYNDKLSDLRSLKDIAVEGLAGNFPTLPEADEHGMRSAMETILRDKMKGDNFCNGMLFSAVTGLVDECKDKSNKGECLEEELEEFEFEGTSEARSIASLSSDTERSAYNDAMGEVFAYNVSCKAGASARRGMGDPLSSQDFGVLGESSSSYIDNILAD